MDGIISGEAKTSTSGIKAAIKNVKHTAQNTKLACVDCIIFFYVGNALQKEA